MYFWSAFILPPLLFLTLLSFRPRLLPLAAPLSTVGTAILYWDALVYYEWRPLICLLLCIQIISVSGAAVLLSLLKKQPRRQFFLTLASGLTTAMCAVVPCRYMDLVWSSGFSWSTADPTGAFLLLIPFGLAIALSLWLALRGPNPK